MRVWQRATAGVLNRRPFVFWGLFCGLSGSICLVYGSTAFAAGRGQILLPLDDVYIHFQYARQLAAGQPYVYNPGLPPTSGATSFLYPYLLAAGYLLGFQGLNLGLWALALGMVALAGALWLVFRLARTFGAGEWTAAGLAAAFGLTGAVSWHFMSGMETGLVILLVLATLYGMVERRLAAWCGAATLLALARPEGGVLALLSVAAMAWQLRGQRARRLLWLLAPALAIGVQPLVNGLLTGSVVASGNAAKSIFGVIPFDAGEVARRLLANLGRMWQEFVTGCSPREGVYLLPPVFPLAVVGAGVLLLRRNLPAWLALGWLLAGTLAVATLDTAFWHFKRYQMPLMILFYPLSAAALARVPAQWGGQRLAAVAAVGLALASLVTGAAFLGHFALNVGYVYAQPLQMTRWLAENTPADVVVAVHDTGLMRYQGGRTTLDMVGLTTPGAADAWRNGPGAVAEFLLNQRPDYIAAYGAGHGFGLSMLAATQLYGRPLAEFSVPALDDRFNVALAGPYQGIYRPDWSRLERRPRWSPGLYDNYLAGQMVLLGALNVADLTQERQARYIWRNDQPLAGFPTEVHEQSYPGCAGAACAFLDGGRRLNGEESFDLRLNVPGGEQPPIWLVTRLHPMTAGTLDIYVNDTYVGRRWIPAQPGVWLDVPTLIPAALFSNPLRVRIVPQTLGGAYMPYFHAAYLGHEAPAPPSETPVATFQGRAIWLADAEVQYRPGAGRLEARLSWYSDGRAEGDYRVFVHLYRDPQRPPDAQVDQRPGQGGLPPGNWLPGLIRDTMVIELADIRPGKYQVAVGMYDPVTGSRLLPDTGSPDGRIVIGDVEILP